MPPWRALQRVRCPRYFNGGSVKESTKQRIQEITREYNDEPYAFARLKARESNVVGVVVPTLNSKITSRVVTSIGRYLREQGYEALIKDSDHSIDLELKNIQRLINLKVDGILLVPSSSDGLESALTKCKEAGIPIINLDTKLTDESLANVGLDIPFYGTNNYEGAKLAGEYVAKNFEKGTKTAILKRD